MSDPIRVMIVDDEPIACRRIQRLLKAEPDVEIVQIAANGQEAIEGIRNHQPHLVFLDVQMPGTDGFEVVKAIGPQNMPHIIFVTAYDRYAIRAFEVHALDYLLKPFDQDRFKESLQR